METPNKSAHNLIKTVFNNAAVNFVSFNNFRFGFFFCNKLQNQNYSDSGFQSIQLALLSLFHNSKNGNAERYVDFFHKSALKHWKKSTCHPNTSPKFPHKLRLIHFLLFSWIHLHIRASLVSHVEKKNGKLFQNTKFVYNSNEFCSALSMEVAQYTIQGFFIYT